MSGVKCINCGCTDIEEDNARGDAVCTSCGAVLDYNLIVSEVQFEEIGHGSSAIGQFVAADSNGGATNYGYGKFQLGSGNESREVTIKKAKYGISHLCHQLQLSQHYIETALNFFKMALMRHLTRGRRNTHIYSACVYITCRTEGTSHLLIDISDVLQICSYELGRTYLRLANALCIKIPSVDPCLYIMRFANKLQFGKKSHEVSMTALRIVQRMKKDSIHSGRRPTGLCGAALLIAARMHDFSRTITDIIQIVKIHESTLRKRLVEFAETPSSALTFDEFMSVDLEAEQDPPAFKAARKKDRERILKIGDSELSVLQRKIDEELEKDVSKVNRRFKGLTDTFSEELDTNKFIAESNLNAINEYLVDDPGLPQNKSKTVIANSELIVEGLKPDISSMCTPSSNELLQIENSCNDNNGELSLEGLDDDEIDGYIMTENEAKYKNTVWMKLNAEYLEETKAKEEKLAKEREEGKPERKRRKTRKRVIGPSNSAGEAIEKMLQEKKISSKINYDILRTLTEPKIDQNSAEQNTPEEETPIENIEVKPDKKTTTTTPAYSVGKAPKKPKLEMGLPVVSSLELSEELLVVNEDNEEEDVEPEPEIEQEREPEAEYSSLKDILNNEEDDYYGYDDY